MIRKVLIISVFILSSLKGISQDVALTAMVYPVQNQRVHLQFTYPIEFILKNTGTTAIPANTLMQLHLLFDGTLANSYNLQYPNKLNKGDSISVTIPALTISTPNPTINVCVVVRLPGDLNLSNDTICNLLRFSIDTYVDLSPVELDIVIPIIDSVIKPGESIYKLTSLIKNLGSVTLPRDYQIKAETKMYTQTKSFSDKTKSAFDTSALFSMNLIGSQPVIKDNPVVFQICITLVNNPDDKNNSNDEYCQTFYAYDPTAVGEPDQTVLNSFENQGLVHLRNLPDKDLMLTIYSSSGALLRSEIIPSSSKQGLINVSDLNSGLYILNITNDGLLIHSNKFTIW